MMFRKARLVGKCFQLRPVGCHQMDVAGAALGPAYHLNATRIVNEDQQLEVPGHHASERVRAKAALAGQAQRQTRECHAHAGLFARGLHLGARAGDLQGEAAQCVGIEPIYANHLAAQC